jgi:hypothetical protein
LSRRKSFGNISMISRVLDRCNSLALAATNLSALENLVNGSDSFDEDKNKDYGLEEETTEEEGGDDFGTGIGDVDLAHDPLSVADVDMSGEGVMSAKFEGNLIISSFLLMMMLVCHYSLEFGIRRPHLRWIHSEIMVHSQRFPHLAMPHFFGHHRHHITKDQAAKIITRFIRRVGAVEMIQVLSVKMIATASEKSATDTSAISVGQSSKHLLAVDAFRGMSTGADHHLHPDIHNLEHKVVLMAHRAASTANPLKYKVGHMITSILSNNPFPSPELFFIGVVYQGACQSSSAIMTNSGDQAKAAAAGIIFIALPVGYFLFVCYQCIYEVWWKGRAEYYIPHLELEAPPESWHPEVEASGGPAAADVEGEIAPKARLKELLASKARSRPFTFSETAFILKATEAKVGDEETRAKKKELKKAKPLQLEDMSVALEAFSDDEPERQEVDDRPLRPIVRVLEETKNAKTRINREKAQSRAPKQATSPQMNGGVVDEGVVVASDKMPGEWNSVLVKMSATGETRRLPAERVEIVRTPRRRCRSPPPEEATGVVDRTRECSGVDFIDASGIYDETVDEGGGVYIESARPTSDITNFFQEGQREVFAGQDAADASKQRHAQFVNDLRRLQRFQEIRDHFFVLRHQVDKVSADMSCAVADPYEHITTTTEIPGPQPLNADELFGDGSNLIAGKESSAPATLEGDGKYEEQSTAYSRYRRARRMDEMTITYVQDGLDDLLVRIEEHDEDHEGGHNKGVDEESKGKEGGVMYKEAEEEEEEEEEKEEEEEEEEEEEGWVDAFEDDTYCDRYASLFDFARGPRTAAIFGPLDTVRMLIVGFCAAVLVTESQAIEQAKSILGIHALQFVLQLLVPPEPSLWDRALDTFAMATDLLPLVIAVLPSPDGCGGPLPIGTQMLVMGAALLATGQRIIVLLTDMIPRVLGLVFTIAKLLFAVAKVLICGAKKVVDDTLGAGDELALSASGLGRAR